MKCEACRSGVCDACRAMIRWQIEKLQRQWSERQKLIPRGIPLRVGDRFITDRDGKVIAYFSARGQQ